MSSIGDVAFSGCDSLKCITIPPSVTSIGKNVFQMCPSLTEITIPSSLKIDNLGIGKTVRVNKI